MLKLDRITMDPAVMGGKPCIRGMRVTVGTVIGLLACGKSHDEILALYPYLDAADIGQALAYAAWRVEEQHRVQKTLHPCESQLQAGALVTLGETSGRVRLLPLN
jgi:uncharacterized protein (DUF433 family)